MRSPDPKLIITIAFLIVALGVLVYSTRQTVVEIEDNRPFAMIPADKQQDAPDFTLTTADGQTITLSQAVKKGPVMLDFWATWCVPCRMEMPELQKVYEKYKDRGVQLYGVNANDKSQIIGAFSRDYHVEFPTLVDSKQTVAASYGVQSIPLVVIVDKDMHVTASDNGFDPNTKADLPRTLDKLLGS
jgi:peroxiredoxin